MQMDGFTRRREQSKANIRRAAWALFSQFGVEKVSVHDIARKAGVSHATIYNNFGSKDALVREYVADMIDQLVDRVQELLTTDVPYREKMATFTAFLESSLNRPNTATPIFPANVDLLQDPDIRGIRETAQARTIELLLGLVEEGKQQGEVHPHLSPAALEIYFKTYMDLFTDPRLHGRLSNDPALVRDLGALMVHGLSGECD